MNAKMNKTTQTNGTEFLSPSGIPVDIRTLRHDILETSLISDPNHPMFTAVPSRFDKTKRPLFSKPVDHELAARFSYEKNGVEIVTIPMNRFGYCTSYDGSRAIFVKSELPRAIRSLIIRWGLEVFAQDELVPFKQVFDDVRENAAAVP